eukprot:1142877-Pelagomonas_calceolata.AAC.6
MRHDLEVVFKIASSSSSVIWACTGASRAPCALSRAPCTRSQCAAPRTGVTVLAEACAGPHPSCHTTAGRAPCVVRHQVRAEQPEVCAVGRLSAGEEVRGASAEGGVAVKSFNDAEGVPQVQP